MEGTGTGGNERVEGHILFKQRSDVSTAAGQEGRGDSYSLHINTFLQLQHHAVDAPFQECPSVKARISVSARAPRISKTTTPLPGAGTYVSSRSSL